ncbi:Protein of unknown function DUF2229, CoA enzyme activase [Halanaerobium hydrogeniformans]|uniref:DUF2229 domain-containing protein n=1 Tax=Halanaerobium hydrogeniformans TaxID=656519 RepID=E4RMX9_HALHG|nr:acyl-CoA dehydratase activase-related protein [Halanaerobium hydrogeniformans]ADQ14196.1 Protein of unknown function DUF2229, CoA enzyme activase [Halanaerobium hydrogeniformans]
MDKIKIGIPRALIYYYYFPFWLKLFSSLGMEVVVSDPTSREQLDQGIKNSLSEICVPIKIIVGHVLDLQQKGVDYIYLPRFKSLRKDAVLCPKFLGLPDLFRHSLPQLNDFIISDTIESKSDDISDYSNYKQLAEVLNLDKSELKKALKKASVLWLRFRKLLFDGYLIDEFLALDNIGAVEAKIDKLEKATDLPQSRAEVALEEGMEETLDIALIGYVYNIYDNYVNMDIINKFKELGVRIHTFSMVKNKIIEKELKELRKPMFWEFTNKLYGASQHFFKDNKIDGLIHITAFGCGPDSILGQILELDAKKYDKPFMTLRIDEQTGESHITTRIEAFIDMLRLKKESS